MNSNPVLLQLAEQIGIEHNAANDRQRKAGELLLEAKRQTAPGDWTKWLEDNFDFTPATAQGYMRMAGGEEGAGGLGDDLIAKRNQAAENQRRNNPNPLMAR